MKILIIFLLLLAATSIMGAWGEDMTASWYSVESCKKEGTWKKWGGKTASGEVFNDKLFTCASWHFPINSFIKVTNKNNKKSIIVRVNDRLSRRLARAGRVLDLSKASFSRLACLDEGIIPIEIKIIK